MISEELKKMFEGRIAMQDMHYVGKACYGYEGGNRLGRGAGLNGIAYFGSRDHVGRIGAGSGDGWIR